MSRLIMLRHGETQWNRDGLFRGRKEVDLSPVGQLQAEAAARAIWPELVSGFAPVRLVSSPLRRALSTSEAIGKLSGLEVEVSQELQDVDYGQFEGLTVEEASKAYPEVYLAWQHHPELVSFPGGESLSSAFERAQAFVNRVLSDRGPSCTIAVSHRVPIKLMIMSVLGLPLSAFWQIRVDNASISVAETWGSIRVLVLCNDTCHLKLARPITRDF
ncbi:MAG: histidine phosphatase family protein [Bacillota bacterium]